MFSGSFFCDCGEKGESHCKSLKKRTTSSSAGKKLKQTTLIPTAASTSGIQVWNFYSP